MGGTTRLSVNFHSMKVSNYLDFIKYGVVDCHILSTSLLTLNTQGGEVVKMETLLPLLLVPLLSMESGVEYFLITLSTGV